MTDLQKIEQIRKELDKSGRTYRDVYRRFFDELWSACEEDMSAEWAYNDVEDGTDEDFENDVASQFVWKLIQLSNVLRKLK